MKGISKSQLPIEIYTSRESTSFSASPWFFPLRPFPKINSARLDLCTLPFEGANFAIYFVRLALSSFQDLPSTGLSLSIINSPSLWALFFIFSKIDRGEIKASRNSLSVSSIFWIFSVFFNPFLLQPIVLPQQSSSSLARRSRN